ncbi:uncharacterized protein LOC108734736 isoform X2 [Agrilus planipennis]|uniref:Uncharacterized protein LOC108734736 isoform X2 n=1 Tax=Agrilus planipennis TaxID=224129 RepID=A0A1W4WD75_AGRPL|nr:uncharacterized protein LOC108734736 isoform X3 [Agrilus planipennis]XP_025832217.1 uncharacterized protein LOC108734736 isoform X2 [Agrilus planipennis]
MKNKPLSTSTPVNKPSGRPQCRNTYRDVGDPFSPINRNYSNNMSSRVCSTSTTKEKSDSESDRDLSSTDDNVEEHSVNKLKKFSAHSGIRIDEKIPESSNFPLLSSTFLYILALMAVTVAVSYQTFFSYSSDPTVTLSITDLKNNFPHQRLDTWIAIESGIHDIQIMNKPSVFLIIYDDQTQDVLNKFIKDVSVFASCTLNGNCSVNPVELKGEKLHDLQIQDYGILIDKYHSQIQQKSVMIIYNLEEVPAELAQAFHVFCDEYNPLVRKSAYFFTMKIKNDEGSTISDIEGILRQKWYSLKDDLFDPLFTRISSMIIVIQPEDS